jgi:hypothetical protein
MRVLAVTPEGAELLHEHMDPVEEPVDLSETAAAATPGPERVYPTDGYTRALLM